MTYRFISGMLAGVICLAAVSWTSASAAVQALPTCDPAAQSCPSPSPTPEITPNVVTPTPTVTTSPRPSTSPSVSPSPSPAGTAATSTSPSGCGDFWANPLTLGAQCSQPIGSSANLFGQGGYFQRIANALIFLVGAVSVVMVIIGALRFVISMGNAKQVTAARDTILYAVIGIVVAFTSYAVVNFVITQLGRAT